MDFRLTDEQTLIQESAIRFGEKWGPRMEEIKKRTLETGAFPDEWWKDFAAAGLMDALCILRAGPDEARKRYLPAIARGDMKMAFAIAGFNVVIVDPEAKGFSMTELGTEGIEGLKQWTLHFDDVIVEQLIGEEHQGIVPMFDVDNAPCAVDRDRMRALFESALDYGTP